ncbi:hypothetical protein [Photobacterium alginatilyticum]|uniref:Uncharacterized protein n=1 Tax=Photobacterium alginatilyticum TaxID=1775171 RepID=A0ABW9YLG3_9GAMM|nr:hypothetical protein [Photobacterium alginatilyticum]NBI54689.1 hypothetical protein [Photobacterium alginatilyticum]
MNTAEKVISHEVYLKHLELKLEKIREISKISEEEALALCCCYIEAIGSKRYELANQGKRGGRYSKTAAFTDTLVNFSGYDFWDKIHPIALLGYLPEIFDKNYDEYVVELNEIGDSVREPDFVRAHIEKLYLNSEQRKWVKKHIRKASIASLAYSKVRCEIVHNISHQPISFLASHNVNKLPDIDFKLMDSCLTNIIDNLRQLSIEHKKVWWEF